MRSLLFVPGDSPRKFGRARTCAADVLILDLEDSVAAQAKVGARSTAGAMLQQARTDGGVKQQLYVRVNALDTGLTLDDLAAVVPHGPDGIMLPKCRGGEDVRLLGHWLDALEAACDARGAGREPIRILPVATETADAVFGLGSYRDCSPRLMGLTWGAEDLAASLGSASNRDEHGFHAPFWLARNLCLMGAAAAGVTAIDTVYVDIADIAGLREECSIARRDGFTAKMVIHPSHVVPVNEAFAVTEQELDWALKVIAAFDQAAGQGVLTMDGAMLDKPHLRRAERIVARAKGV